MYPPFLSIKTKQNAEHIISVYATCMYVCILCACTCRYNIVHTCTYTNFFNDSQMTVC